VAAARAEKGAKLRVIPVDDSGQVLLDEYQKLLNDRTKIVAVTQVSNALGTVVPVKEIVAWRIRAGARTLVDGAQSVSHMRVDVQALDADFFVFSGPQDLRPDRHRRAVRQARGARRDAAVAGRRQHDRRRHVREDGLPAAPTSFEAGTGNIADAVGLGAALDYVERIGIENIGRYEHELLDYATHHWRRSPACA
jgi:cysteine desulfurase/selenocysteine lyase